VLVGDVVARGDGPAVRLEGIERWR
jgi:hypothetical protein